MKHISMEIKGRKRGIDMADIELIIKIDEEEYKKIKAYTSFMPWTEYLIKNGTPLNEVLDKINAEIEEIETYDGIYIDRFYVLEIIDKYRGESDCRECKAEHDCYECKKYEESEEGE